MSITVLLLAQAKPEEIENFKRYIAECLPETRAYQGCITIDIFEEKNNEGHFVFYEDWEGIAAYEAYLDYRTKQGVMDKIGAMLIKPPEITYYNKVAI